MTNVKDYKVTNLEWNKFQVQEQLTNWQFGKCVKVTIPQELLEGKDFNETIDLVKARVNTGRETQKERVSIQKANNQAAEIPEVFDEDELLEMIQRDQKLTFNKKRAIYGSAAIWVIISCVILLTNVPANAAEPLEVIEPVVELNKYEKIQEQINQVENKRISELQYIEEVRTIKKNAIDMHNSKIASYNDDINAGKDRILNLDAEIAKLKKQQVLEATIVSD